MTMVEHLTMVEHYTPTREDVLYIQQLIRVLRDGGTWGFPGTPEAPVLLFYSIDKTERVLRLLNEDMLDVNPTAYDMHQRTIIVWWHLGYAVTPTPLWS